MTRCKVDCVMGHDVKVQSSGLVIDDAEGVYRFTCPQCDTPNEKAMSDRIRGLLRQAGVATIEELVSNASIVLREDADIWEALEMPA